MLVRFLRHAFGQKPHEPGDARQTSSLVLQARGIVADRVQFEFRRFRRRQVLILSGRTQHPPLQSHLVIRPCRHHIVPTSQNTMEMVTHDRKPQNLNPHNACQKLHSLPNEFPSLLIIVPCQRIHAAEKSPPNASIDAVHDLNFTIRQQDRKSTRLNSSHG